MTELRHVLRAGRPGWGTAIVVAFCLLSGLDTDMLVDWAPTGEFWWGLAVNTVLSLALFWGRAYPWPVLALVVVGDALSVQTQAVVYAVAMYFLAANRPLRQVSAGAAGSLAVLGAETFLRSGRDDFGIFLAYYGTAVIGAVLIGANVAIRRRYVQALVDRAAQLAREKEQEGQLAAARERARIAHDLHDIVAHNLTIMVRLADGATAVADSDPQRSRRAVERAADLGREAMKDMRRLLGVLHDGSPDSGGDLESMVATFRIAGLPVTLRRRGLDPVSPGLQRVIFRIVQEGLTNALRYAEHPSEVLVDLDYTGPILIVITDDGRGTTPAPSVGSEQGLNAMRERAALYGGTVEAGRRPVGWSVRVTLPHPTEETS
ncbi:sensor histidine kinase [Actinoplanes couchii]|uniref:histidine kinase n=1 Tax=Actinoplanes couchii TaxID=403638 RepID=A0ABQ3X8K6_9ACTN|nr:histidine kinase [Actinoplanes couchii]MDR6320159.1 signal transduction histidine kinase [Actinoplanes couchii]GID54827.1 two-component sensor histidine kinase [Actinoplanes couchii]